MSASNSDGVASQTIGNNGGVVVGIVLGVLAGIIVILILLSRLVCKNRGGGSPNDLEAGERKKIASILKLDGVTPSRTYEQGQEEIKSEPRSSSSFENVIVCVICLDILQGDEMVRHLPCHHYFRSSCLDMWYLQHHHTCPLCETTFFKACQKKETIGAESSSLAGSSQTR